MNRRDFFKFGAASPFFLSQKQEEKKDEVFVYYVNIGNLPPDKAHKFLARMQDRLKEHQSRKIFIPVRNEDNRIERFDLNKINVMLVYVGVGCLPPHKAEQHVERTKDRLRTVVSEDECKAVFLPTRLKDTMIETA